MSSGTIQADFDRLALLEKDGWNHNRHYYSYLLRHLPSPCEESLEIGCGTGSFTRLLAYQSKRVLALDLSPQMIRIAREQSKLYTNIESQVADVLSWPFPAEQYDCIISIATFHHLPLETTLPKVKQALKPNGVLILLDLFQSEGLFNLLTDVAAFPSSIMLRLVYTRRLQEPREVREA
jgi:SAM-dependent methyltransferase